MPELAGGDEGEYVLRVRGESMKNAGILEGDYVVVRPQDTAGDGEIVVALVGEEATVKRFFREDDHIRLQPENDDASSRSARARCACSAGSSACLGPWRALRVHGAPGADARRCCRGWNDVPPARHRVPGLRRSMQPRWTAGAGCRRPLRGLRHARGR